MLGKYKKSQVARLAIAGCLAFFLSSASLIPLAAGAFGGESASSCCRGRGKCCCRKAGAKPPVGPAWSSVSCRDDCGRMAVAGIVINGLVRPFSSSLAPPTAIRTVVMSGRFAVWSGLADDARRQRPPPRSLLA